ncbi:MAG: hypothetical protein COV67_15010 [Nitrospinae bacterium CG11_big_fil_rev_8_21_14_0_20_56_8]|nr:MAG: hypothetical protein COV67_15010 [Nitrospinae bacterium CG11_big_fil_rev_8_21_14_0_20_56_8]
MKKISFLTLVLFAVLCVNASAQEISKGQSVSCNDAKSIEISVAKLQTESSDKFGYTTNDRGTASLVVWKSANFTTIPITLGPNDSNMTLVTEDHGHTGIEVRGTMGSDKVVLNHQPEFSRGDSIGDIRGEVKITNVGPVPASVNCN